MAIVLEANYTKKLGLPGYSSHQYSVTLRLEVPDVSKADSESKRLYALLQTCVDRELKCTGFVPAATGGGANGPHLTGPQNGESPWNCSAKQQEFILKLMREQQMPRNEVEQLAQTMFNVPLVQLNKLQASGLIDELTHAHSNGRARGRKPAITAGGRS